MAPVALDQDQYFASHSWVHRMIKAAINALATQIHCRNWLPIENQITLVTHKFFLQMAAEWTSTFFTVYRRVALTTSAEHLGNQRRPLHRDGGSMPDFLHHDLRVGRLERSPRGAEEG
jgi:hypothetical protein